MYSSFPCTKYSVKLGEYARPVLYDVVVSHGASLITWRSEASVFGSTQ